MVAVTLGVAAAVAVFLLTVHLGYDGAATSGAGALSVRLTPSSSEGYAPLTVTLTATVSGGTPPYEVTWNSGSTLLGSGSTSIVAFDATGNQTITARVVDASGGVATGSTVIAVISPYPQAEAFLPPQASVNTDLLAIDWHASAPVSSCILASWGATSIPTFSGCGAAGGDVRSGTSGESVVFQVDPDDPEVTPVLFQSTDPGVQISVGWWYNNTSPAVNEQSGVGSLTTAVEPL